MQPQPKQNSFMRALATFIVDKHKAFYLIFIALCIYCVLSMSKVELNSDLTSYLPVESETRQSLEIMEEQFTTYGTARVMVSNITYDTALQVQKTLQQLPGIYEAVLEETQAHYTDASALFEVTLTDEESTEAAHQTVQNIRALLSEYDLSIYTMVGQAENELEQLNRDVQSVLVIAVFIILAVLLFTSKAYLQIPVFLITFVVAAILNKGTNYWLESISTVTDSIAVVLQLALAIDYAIIFSDRFMEEHEHLPVREAVIEALAKAIPEISSSSLTTVSGMVAMMFMQFRIGFDMGVVLTKAILLSLFTVFFLMPGLLLLFAKGIDHTRHRNFVPTITPIGKFAIATRYVMPCVFVVMLGIAFWGQAQTQYVYSVNSVETTRKSQMKVEQEAIEANFGASNKLAVVVPAGNYTSEKALLARLSALPYVNSALGLSNVEINDEYVLTDSLTTRQFAELTDLDIEMARLAYTAYAYTNEQYAPIISGVDDYSVPLIDMFLFVADQKNQGFLTLEDDLNERIDTLSETLNFAKVQLQGEDYARFILDLSLPEEGDETKTGLAEIRAIIAEYYPTAYLAGNSTSALDLEQSFVADNTMITVLTALFVIVILLFTFQSAGLPLLLVLTIQGSIWVNFAFPHFMEDKIFFMSYLIVSAIQMGATIDYAIVITSRYAALKKQMPIYDAMIETLNQAFPTVFTSGTILTSAGFLIGFLSSDATVAGIGTALGRGSLISILMVLFVLPQLLLLGDALIEKTAFTLRKEHTRPLSNGIIKVDGRVSGYISGRIDAEVKGTIRGTMQGTVEARGLLETAPISDENTVEEDLYV